ncbi:MAG: hypothetical protein AAFV07_07845, partial [Bacteroidota bacterium]
ILHTTFYYHLIPLARLLAHAFQIDNRLFVKLLRQIVRETIQVHQAQTSHIQDEATKTWYQAELNRIQKVLLAAPLQAKSLLKMSLVGTHTTLYTPSQNILAEVGELNPELSELQA